MEATAGMGCARLERVLLRVEQALEADSLLTRVLNLHAQGLVYSAPSQTHKRIDVGSLSSVPIPSNKMLCMRWEFDRGHLSWSLDARRNLAVAAERIPR
jgi:hypothetical protein